MKLLELEPRWVGAGGEGVWNADGSPAPARAGVGVSFLCPCPPCTAKRTGDPDHDFYLRVFVGLRNPVDGGPAYDPRPGAQWERIGDTFDVLTLTPSIQRHQIGEHGCNWHGFVTNGEILTC
jgi:hypothetical protein